MTDVLDVVVIGGGQAGLAAGYHLRRSGLSFAILDAEVGPGGAWRHAWDSLRLFSPARHSSLPGRPMPGTDRDAPHRDDVLAYLADYERRYALPIVRPVLVERVEDAGATVRVVARTGIWHARAVISATGTWRAPYVPRLPGRARFAGRQLHSATYRNPGQLAGARRIGIVGGGNSGAQILAELSRHAETVWMTERPPRFMPDHVDGRVLFDVATAARDAHGDGVRRRGGVGALGDIVMVPSVRAARERGALVATGAPVALEPDGAVRADGSREPLDAIVWCTGFAPATGHLAPLGVLAPDGRVAVAGTRAIEEPRLWLLGYGDWTGYASATLIGVGRSARATVEQVAAAVG